MDWHLLADIVTLLGTVTAVGVVYGRLRQQVTDMSDTLDGVVVKMQEHEVAEGAQNQKMSTHASEIEILRKRYHDDIAPAMANLQSSVAVVASGQMNLKETIDGFKMEVMESLRELRNGNGKG